MIKKILEQRFDKWQDDQDWRHKAMSENRKALQRINQEMFKRLTVIAQAMFFMLYIVCLVSDDFRGMLPVYLVWNLAVLAGYFIFRSLRLSLAGLYLYWSVMTVASIYLSVAVSPLWPATAMLGTLLLSPITVTDESWRTVAFTGGCYLLYVVADILFKGSELLTADLVTCGCFGAVGILLGEYFQHIRLKYFETQRYLLKRKKEGQDYGKE